MKIIGISGGSGSGKSTVSRILEKQLPNAIHINGDLFMHEESNKLEQKILNKIGVKKDEDVFSYNYYLETFENVKTWVNVIEESVISKAKNMIQTEGINKDYIIIDWVFLPLCDYFKNCDYTICISTDFEIRKERLTKRLQDKNVYNEGDRSFWSYKPGIIDKRLRFTELNKLGYPSEYEITNDGNIEELHEKIENFINAINTDSNLEKFSTKQLNV